MRIFVLVILLLTPTFSTQLFSQGELAVPFLLISASPISNGLGQTSAGIPISDPLVIPDNPAQLGLISLNNYAAVSYNQTHWLPQFLQSDLILQSHAVQIGVNLNRINPAIPELAIGYTRSQMTLDLGTFYVTNAGPGPSYEFKGYESSVMNTLGAALHYGVTISAGITFKQITSVLAPVNVQGQGMPGIAEASTYDYGVLAVAPLANLLDRTGFNVGMGKRVSPVVNVSSGFSKNNMGDNTIRYQDSAQPDALPRYGRLGIGTEVGIDYSISDAARWRLIGFSWSAEANDLLVSRVPAVTDSNGTVTSPSHWEYRDGFGDIQFGNELIAGHINDETIRKRGWEVNVAEILYVRGGRFDEGPTIGNRHFNTAGVTLRSGGVWKVLKAVGVEEITPFWVNFIVRHFDIAYTQSEYDADLSVSPLAGTKQNGWMISVMN